MVLTRDEGSCQPKALFYSPLRYSGLHPGDHSYVPGDKTFMATALPCVLPKVFCLPEPSQTSSVISNPDQGEYDLELSHKTD